MARLDLSWNFIHKYIEDPFDRRDRGWRDADESYSTSGRHSILIPQWLMWMCVSGQENPWRSWLGNIEKGLLLPLPDTQKRDEWSLGVFPNMDCSYDASGYYGRGYHPVIPKLGRRCTPVLLRAPFPVTLDDQLIAHAACSIGETEWVPFAPLINGRCSREMLRLMNMFPHKPAFIIYQGVLHLWINVEHWGQVEPRISYYSLQPYIELELFRAYRVYYEQLRRELAQPYSGPVWWPDQCDPRFPLPGDPRGAHYGMWIYSGGLTYGENATETYGIR
ncbi:hypothetical protein [Bifidobacterium saguinibicoloris]|uniref:hypothetical protein n=1 Tax=Bifidobacterium saguinibicoloris TaxID=2834433 RepID=UPI001C57CDB4|nr:hypothetical protein [Bifidobacterium saguinibicoloris]MBW3081122.1 hypothetical protein [Bifidobacterium saguinibicoloris]